MAPTIISLALMDYKNVDKLAYDVIVNRILYNRQINNNKLINVIHPFLREYELTYLTAILFNHELDISKAQRDLITVVGKFCYGGYCFVDRYCCELRKIDSIDQFEEFKRENKNNQGKYPIDIRYFILDNPIFSSIKETLINEFFCNFVWGDDCYIRENTLKEYNELIMDYEMRAKLRRLKELPF